MTPPILHFCDYLLFEEDLALDLCNYRFPIPKGFDRNWPVGSGEKDF
jgi:hypothetical protein